MNKKAILSITGRDLEIANKLLKKLIPDAEPFMIETTPLDEYSEEQQEMISKSLDLSIYCGEIIPDNNPFLKCRGFIVQISICNPGVRYYKDGSGEPPSWDVVDVKEFDHFYKALIFLFEEYFSIEIHNTLQNIEENSMFVDEERNKLEIEKNYEQIFEI